MALVQATPEQYVLRGTFQIDSDLGKSWPHPVVADGKIFLSARDGKVTVVQAGRTFKIVSQNDVGEALAASPAISNGTIYLRTFDALWAIRAK